MQTAVDPVNQGDGLRLAHRFVPGAPPAVLFLPGFASSMAGTKALHLERHCLGRGQAFARFDYRGHGASPGRLEEGCVGDWLEDALAVVDRLAPAPLVLVGSSMGGWVMLLAALARPGRVAGLVGVAAAPDLTEDLRRLGAALDRVLEQAGVGAAPQASLGSSAASPSR